MSELLKLELDPSLIDKFWLRDDPKGERAIEFALRWATAIEDSLSKGVGFDQATSASYTSLCTEMGVKWRTYGVPVQLLRKVWRHGEQLYAWHDWEVISGM